MVSPPARIGNIENNKHKPAFETIERLEMALGIPLKKLREMGYMPRFELHHNPYLFRINFVTIGNCFFVQHMLTSDTETTII